MLPGLAVRPGRRDARPAGGAGVAPGLDGRRRAAAPGAALSPARARRIRGEPRAACVGLLRGRHRRGRRRLERLPPRPAMAPVAARATANDAQGDVAAPPADQPVASPRAGSRRPSAMRAVGVDIECERPARSDVGERAALMLAPAELRPGKPCRPSGARTPALLTRAGRPRRRGSRPARPTPRPGTSARHRRPCACERAAQDANVRTWDAAPPVHVAVCAAPMRLPWPTPNAKGWPSRRRTKLVLARAPRRPFA